MEVRRDPRLKALRLTYINNGMRLVIELVTARFVRQATNNPFQMLQPLLVFLPCHLVLFYVSLLRSPLFMGLSQDSVSRGTLLSGQEGGELNTLKKVTSVESFVCNFDDEVHIDLLRMEVLHELVNSLCCTTCC